VKKTINIAIADDHEIVVEGFKELFKRNPEITVMFTAEDGKVLLDKLKANQPQIILLDLDMPVMSGDEVFDKIKKKYPKVKIIIISSTYRPAIIYNYIKKGASSFLHKNCSHQDLVKAIHGVDEHGTYFDPKVQQIIANEVANPTTSEPLVSFTRIELDVLKLLHEGLTMKEIGTKLNIDPRIAEYHKTQMMKKINTNNSIVLIVYAIKHNLV
jgi:DNA-binding NarL/FixJ family response regulator